MQPGGVTSLRLYLTSPPAPFDTEGSRGEPQARKSPRPRRGERQRHLRCYAAQSALRLNCRNTSVRSYSSKMTPAKAKAPRPLRLISSLNSEGAHPVALGFVLHFRQT